MGFLKDHIKGGHKIKIYLKNIGIKKQDAKNGMREVRHL